MREIIAGLNHQSSNCNGTSMQIKEDTRNMTLEEKQISEVRPYITTDNEWFISYLVKCQTEIRADERKRIRELEKINTKERIDVEYQATEKNMEQKTAEEWYQEFRKLGFTHQEARELALKVENFKK